MGTRSLKVATGAAYATTNVLTVDKFFARGAAVGIQVREPDSSEWYDTAPILCYLVCNPSPVHSLRHTTEDFLTFSKSSALESRPLLNTRLLHGY